MSDEIIVIVIFLSLLFAIIFVFVFAYILNKYQERFVLNASRKIKTLKQVNDTYVFNKLKERYEITFNLSSKKQFDNFDSSKKIDVCIIENLENFEHLCKKVEENINKYKSYQADIDLIKKYDTVCKLPLFITKRKFKKLENNYIEKMIIKPATSFRFDFQWSYITPKQRRKYYDFVSLDNKKIQDRVIALKNIDYSIQGTPADYKTIKEEEYYDHDTHFLLPLARSENHPVAEGTESVAKDDEIVKNALLYEVSCEMVNEAYSLKQIKDIFKKHKLKFDKDSLEFIVEEKGFIKQKRVDIYIDKKYKSLEDLILQSADDHGIIKYNNIIKDDYYDSAIYKLSCFRQIIPISQLSFLIIDSNIRFGNLTLSDINYFDLLLKNLCQKNRYVSVKTVKDNITCKALDNDYDSCFVYSLVKYSGFVVEVSGVKGLFSTNLESNKRIDFLEFLLEGIKSVDAFDLIYNIKKTYDVEYNIYSITYDLRNNFTSIYYNEETEKLYSNKEYFYEEVL